MIEHLQKKLDNRVLENEPLAPYVWYKIGGPARYFFIAKTNDDLVAALTIADELKLKYFILGSGTNILISDQGFDGLVIKQENNDFDIQDTEVHASSGALVVDVLAASLEAGLTGWPWIAGLPGTIGGAIRGNAGAYGEQIGDITKTVEVYTSRGVQAYTAEQMRFRYRHSRLKEENGVVISVVVQLQHGDVATDKKLVEQYNQRRKDTQPLDAPNTGCTFKNINLAEVKVDTEKIKQVLDLTDEEYAVATKYNKLPASFVIDKLGLKGKSIGGAQVSDKHAAFIVNAGDAKAEHVIALISDIKMHVRDELGIQLQEEIQYVGF